MPSNSFGTAEEVTWCLGSERTTYAIAQTCTLDRTHHFHHQNLNLTKQTASIIPQDKQMYIRWADMEEKFIFPFSFPLLLVLLYLWYKNSLFHGLNRISERKIMTNMICSRAVEGTSVFLKKAIFRVPNPSGPDSSHSSEYI